MKQAEVDECLRELRMYATAPEAGEAVAKLFEALFAENGRLRDQIEELREQVNILTNLAGQ